MKLERSIGFLTGVSYCVTIIIGAGVLGLPGAAAHLAGKNSIYAWAADFLLIIPLLYVFSRLITVVQSAGGIADFVKAAFGPSRLYRFAQALLLITLVIGTAAISLVGAQYLGGALGWGRIGISMTGLLLILLPSALNSLGIRIGGKIQNICAASLILFLFLVIASSFGHWHLNEIFSFDAQNVGGMWTAMGLVWFAFTGVEMISFLGEEFKSPRIFILSIVTSISIVGFLYIGLAIAVKLAVSPDDPLFVGSPLVAILKNTVGGNIARFGGLFGFLIILINQTAAILGASRLVFSVGRDATLLPAQYGKLSARGVPLLALWTLAAGSSIAVLLIQVAQWSLEPVFLIVSQNWFILYVLAVIAFLKLERTRLGLAIGAASLAVSLIFMSTFSWFLVIPLLVAVLICLVRPKEKAGYVG